MYFQQIVKNYIVKFFVFVLVIHFFDIFSFLSSTTYCVPSKNPDQLDISIPKPVMRLIKQTGTDFIQAKVDLAVVAGAAVATKPLPATATAGAIVCLFTTSKFADVAVCLVKNHQRNQGDRGNPSNGGDINIPSVIEAYSNWVDSFFENMSDIQTLAACCAGLISVCIVVFTFLILWVIGREYAEKAKSIMANYGILNKIFLFYLRWGELTSIPARVFFVCFIYVNLSLSIYFLTYIPLFLQQK